jgi:putative heme-binding domain-containing protein
LTELAKSYDGKDRTWLIKLKDGQWNDHRTSDELKNRGLYDPANIKLVTPIAPPAPKSQLPPIAEILALKGDVARGNIAVARCYTCHQINGTGIGYGPDITDFAKRQTAEVVVRSIVEPSAEISHGFAGKEIITKDGTTIHGIELASGNPTIIQSTGDLQQTIPKDRIKSNKPLGRSLMLSADQLALKAQDVADILAFLKSL